MLKNHNGPRNFYQMNVVCLAPPGDRSAIATARTTYERLIEKSGLGGGKFVAVPGENSTEGLSVGTVEKAFRSLIAEQYCEYRGTLRDGQTFTNYLISNILVYNI